MTKKHCQSKTNCKPIYFFKDYLIKTYGQPLYKIPIDLGSGCPNRNEDLQGGCSFCPETAGRSMQTMNQTTINEQISVGIEFAKKRYGAKKFLAYIQSFTASFNPKYQKIYADIYKDYPFSAICFATRPDSLNQEALYYLKKLNKNIDVWIELGIQSIHDKTLKRINRGHDWQTSKNAIFSLNKIGIKTAIHLILGLPGESKEDYIKTAQEISKLPIMAVKIHNLHILKDTQLENEHKKETLKTYSEFEYAEILTDFLSYLSANIAIIRMTTDSLKEELIAPRWHMNKSHFREYVLRLINFKELHQGIKDTSNDSNNFENQDSTQNVAKQTLDGSITYWSDDFKEHYHTEAGARLEAKHKFVYPANLKDGMNILDICLGLGYNTLESINYAKKNNISINIDALEIDKRIVRMSAENIININTDNFNWSSCLKELYLKQKFHTSDKQQKIRLIWGDARHTVTKLNEHYYDVVYLDAFSTQRNSELWTLDFFKKIKHIIKADGMLLTYCAAIPVRNALIQSGFIVGETNPVARKRGGTIASLNPKNIKIPLPKKDIDLLSTNRGIVYRDPYSIWPNKQILRDREHRLSTKPNSDQSSPQVVSN